MRRVDRPAGKRRLQDVGALTLQVRRSTRRLTHKTDPRAMRDVLEVLEVLNTPAEPPLKKDPGPDAMGDKDKHRGKGVLLELSKKRIVEGGAAVVDVGSTLPVRYAVEEVAVLGPLEPDLLHLLRRALEVTKVLFPHPGLFVDNYLSFAAAAAAAAAVCGFSGVVGAFEALEDSLQRFPRAEIWRRVEAD